MTIQAELRRVYGPQADSLFIIVNRRHHSLMVLNAAGDPLAPHDDVDMTTLLDLLERATDHYGGGESTMEPYDPAADSGLPWETYVPRAS